MHILVANIPLPGNRFLVDLNNALGKHAHLIQDHEAFWNMQGDFDVVHLHFPEYMTFEIQKAYQKALSDDLINEIAVRLKHWSSCSAVVITRHVLLPHAARTDPQWERLYELVYSYVHGVVHFAQPSIDEFTQRYAQTTFMHGTPKHSIVPHHNYVSLLNTIDRTQARRQLSIPEDAKVLLVFGGIRNEAEQALVLNSFKQMKVPGKCLLVSRWRETLADVAWIRFKYWLRDLTRLYYKLHPQYRLNYSFVQEEDAQLYLNAADVLLIPRFHVLNSGNITLGMTFGIVVVGPDSLDVGHLLKTTGNVVFDPDNKETVASAIEHAMELAKKGEVGLANQKRAMDEWSADQCAEQYSAFFNQCLK